MVSVKAADMRNKLDYYLQVALKEPVVVEDADRQVAVLISKKEYERLTRLEDADQRSEECLPEGVTGSPCAVDLK